jgi:lysine 2,3-aminomutase
MNRRYNDVPLWKNVTEEQWNDWKWQNSNKITTLEQLEQVVNMTKIEREGIRTNLQKLRMAVTPYYAMLIEPNNSNCPVRSQAVPTKNECNISKYDHVDPLNEEEDSPVKGLIHRYPDRVLMLVSSQCFTYCRHCTRRRLTGREDKDIGLNDIKKAIAYIKNNSEIRDVLLSGGDALCISDEYLKYILKSLSTIKHVEVIRLGTRAPVVMPQRITQELCDMIKKFHPIWVNTHFNHPKELTEESIKACNMLADAGMPLGNQSVLLKNINDCPYIMKSLVQKLVQNRIRPYYIYQCDLSEGIEHFRTSIATGIEIIEMLRGHTSGFAVPTFVIDAPGGGGKIPVAPEYLISQSSNKIILRNFEGVICSYTEPKDKSHICQNCGVCKKYKGKHHGIEKLYQNEHICIVPGDTIRGF